ncbi:glycine cleavage system protein GcvH [Rhodocytophaga aerolata]|uniref:Glycine cleavage system H protein n=1 Tax=Rhodocytophaga aerolata TaxID=455078 RepID=A0ABT8QY62_9BACT|nr:glycine cleavage system protein GcvH [Rhodocytophaga aerolata]MDO1444781.1 glycine cleavage system protein GcvH [Rhodocytophaga aerolata]
MNLPQDLRYTKEHEWLRVEGTTAYVGITDFAQKELGDIVYVEIDTKGKELQMGDVFGTVEAVKTVSDLFLPITGTIIEVNELLNASPELVNSDPYGKGWMIKMNIADTQELESLLSANTYAAMIGE